VGCFFEIEFGIDEVVVMAVRFWKKRVNVGRDQESEELSDGCCGTRPISPIGGHEFLLEEAVEYWTEKGLVTVAFRDVIGDFEEQMTREYPLEGSQRLLHGDGNVSAVFRNSRNERSSH
jgi:hypothetical protein